MPTVINACPGRWSTAERTENGRLKRIVADLTLDRHILQEIVAPGLLRQCQKRGPDHLFHLPAEFI